MESSNSQPVTEFSGNLGVIEEVGITIAAKDLTPTMMSQDFLKFSGIVPQDWELSQQPILNPSSAQLAYTNGVNISAQPRIITFSETLANKKLEGIAIPKVAAKYIEKLPHAEYMGISCLPKMLIPFPQNPQEVRKFIAERLLAPGSWKNVGKAPLQAGINLMYLLEHCQLTVSIAEARLQQPGKPAIAAILFSGSFNYNLPQDISAPERLGQLKQALNMWQQDLLYFRDLVNNKFLTIPESANGVTEASVFPGL